MPPWNRGATATKASKARALPKFWVTVNPISTSGADYAHHSTMGLVWLKFEVALRCFWCHSFGIKCIQRIRLEHIDITGGIQMSYVFDRTKSRERKRLGSFQHHSSFSFYSQGMESYFLRTKKKLPYVTSCNVKLIIEIYNRAQAIFQVNENRNVLLNFTSI